MRASDWSPFPGYKIMENGDIVSTKRVHPRKIKLNWDGYNYPDIRMIDENGKRQKLKLNQVICRAFHGEKPSPLHEARNIDGNIYNNHKDNLAWMTRQEYYAMRR